MKKFNRKEMIYRLNEFINQIDFDKITVKLDELSKFILKRPKIKSMKINETI